MKNRRQIGKAAIAVFALVVGGIVIAANASAAPTGMKIQSITRNVSATFSPNTETVVNETIDVRYRGPGTDYFITFSSGQSGSFTQRIAGDGAGHTTNYQIYDNTTSRNTLEDLTASPSTSSVLSGTFPVSSGWSTQTVSYSYVVQTGQLPIAGTYTDSVGVTLYSGSLGAPTQEDAVNVSYNIQVNAVLNLSLVNAGGIFSPTSTSLSLDFGQLVQGASRQADLLVQSNANYAVAIQSTNGSLLKIQDPTDTSTIPYTMSFGGTAVSLPAGTPVTVVSTGIPTTAAGDRYPMVVTVGTVGMSNEGTYSDTISITVTAR